VRSVFLNNETLRWTRRATGDVTALAMTPSGSGVLAGTENGNVDLFDEYGNLSWSYASNPGNKQAAGITCVALSKEGTVAAAGSYDGKIFALNYKGEEIWSNQTKDHIHHIAMSADGTLVVATGEETVYAFSTSAQSIPVVRTTGNSLTPAPSQSVTTVPGNSSVQKPEIRKTTPRAITAVPTEYSVIRTSTQSPLSGIISLGAILVALLMVMRRR
jgi:WD40 repeat protein